MTLVSATLSHNTFCYGCNGRLFKSESAYKALPEKWYDEEGIYCATCATAITENLHDPTRSTTQYYQDVSGTLKTV
jgi:hypothetical protein